MTSAIRLRPATADDARRLFDWANDPLTRRMARNPDPIPWPEHERWLAWKLASPATRIWIAEADGRAVGQVRLDRQGDAAEIDISVDPRERGRGFGAAMLKALGIAHAPGVATVFGEVRAENAASAAAFRSAGFREDGAAPVAPGYRRFAKRLADG